VPFDLPTKVSVRVKPNSKTEEVIPEDGGFIVRVKEAPKEGKANRAVIRLLAKHLGIPETQLRISRGLTSRTKVIQIL
jgi:uncharacterized protein YggU (UPF0235/DUF167 family)